MEAIRDAPKKALRAIALTLCGDPDDNSDLKKRIFEHIRFLEHFHQLPNGPMTTERVRDASATVLRAVLVTICRGDPDTLNRVLDHLRVLEAYQGYQDNPEDTGNHNFQDTSNHSNKAFIESPAQEFSFESSALANLRLMEPQGAAEGTYMPHESPRCVSGNCESEFRGSENHASACTYHPVKLCFALGYMHSWL